MHEKEVSMLHVWLWAPEIVLLRLKRAQPPVLAKAFMYLNWNRYLFLSACHVACASPLHTECLIWPRGRRF